MKTILFALGLSISAATSAVAQTAYPAKAITLVVPFAAGGTTDIVARLMADHMSRSLGQSIVVENLAGAGGATGATRVAKAAPDGYTLLMGNLGTQAASVGLYPKLAYDPRTDFEPVVKSASTPMLVVAEGPSGQRFP